MNRPATLPHAAPPAPKRSRGAGGRLSRRINRWLWSRLPQRDQHVLVQRNLYILPTRTGWLLGATLLALLIGSINYQLNLGYLLTFLLSGCAVISVPMTYLTLLGLAWQLRPPAPQFAGQAAPLHVTVHNPNARRARLGLTLQTLSEQPTDASPSGDPAPTAIDFDVAAGATLPLQLQTLALARGWQPLPTLQMQTRFPLGVFRVWSVWRPAARVLIYPAPEPHAPPLPWQAQALDPTPEAPTRRAAPTAGAQDVPDQLRPYQHGDSPRHVYWKKAAQTGQLVVREPKAAPSAPQHLWLDWRHAAPERGTEATLSRLCAWVLQADDSQRPYGLHLPDDGLRPALSLPPDTGDAHRLRCLQALAEFGLPLSATEGGARA